MDEKSEEMDANVEFLYRAMCKFVYTNEYKRGQQS